MNLKLHVIICSTRPGRVGPAVARWFLEFARAHGRFEVGLVDLAEVDLPMYDEPVHPSRAQYRHEHTKRWSAIVSAADAYVFVTPEYNFSPPPTFVNALDYVYREWNYKPCGFVSYGGVSGGLRATQMERLHATTLKMMPMMESVMVPMVASQLDPGDGHFTASRHNESAGQAMLDELWRWAEALKPMRG